MSESTLPWITPSSDGEASSSGGSKATAPAELLSSPGWHTSLAQFARATGLTVTLYDTHGVIQAGPFAPTPLGSRLVGSSCWSEGQGVCLRVDREAVDSCLERGATVHLVGLNMLALFAIPVRLASDPIGVVVAGWVFDNFPDPVATDRLGQSIGASFPDLWQIVRQQPPVSHEKLGTYAELLQTICDLFVRERAETLHEQEQTRGLRALYRSAQQLAASTSIEMIGSATIEAIIVLANVRSVRLLVCDEKDQWRTAASHGFDDRLGSAPSISSLHAFTSTLRVPVEAADGSLLGIIETSDAERFSEPRRRTQMAALAAQTAVALHKTRLIAALQQEREELHRANQIKDEFLATLSHELRTPLTPILSWTAILRDTSLDDSEIFSEGVEAIERNARQELHLVEEMLDLTRIMNNKMLIEPVLMHPGTVLASAFAMAQSLADQLGLEVAMEVEHDLPLISADEKRVQQILTNLVSNAVKFTPRGGKITLGARRAGESVELLVSDTGIGIGSELLPYIFDRFRQADSSSTRRHGGLGIGLSVVRGLTKLHGGDARAESMGLGQGTTFVVTFPAVSADTRAREIPPEATTIQASDGEQRRREGKVLIVDDAIDSLISIKMLMERSGYEVETANSVPKAIEAAHRFDPDILVSDLAMPDQDGYDLLRVLHNDPKFSSLPAIALTGFATLHDREMALQAGFIAHLPKPVEFPVLLAVLDRVFEEKRR
jgi:signal transduction histidine kinase/CheY-like chemotaxis protein